MITIERLEFGPEAVNYIWDTIHALEIRKFLPQNYGPYDFVWTMDYWKNGDCDMYVPLFHGEPMGLCHGEVQGEHGEDFSGHYSFFKKFWGGPAQAATEACIARVKEDHKVARMVGHIPIGNRLSLAFAKRMGFSEEGIVEYEIYGDCTKVIKEI